mmetsp:Transcript_17229/g.31006  ORF Transcript_17229/g.31006 Transcript_17229/m.31006 type:complete len:190 (-) Transcript_17229:12244-12813(-)
MCVALTPNQLFAVAGAMTLNNPDIYFSRVSIFNANITNLLTGIPAVGSKTYVLPLSFTAGRLVYLSKSRTANIELWEDLVGPTFDASFLVQSWGRPYMPSYCTPQYHYSMLNAKELQISKYPWPCTDDHSKWGVSIGGSWVCFADINRMTSQASRGGGALCLEHAGLHSVLYPVITATQPCNSSSIYSN